MAYAKGNPGVWGKPGSGTAVGFQPNGSGRPVPKATPKKAKPVGVSPQVWAQQQAQSMIQQQIDAILQMKNQYLAQQAKTQQQAMDRAAAMYSALMGANHAGAIDTAYKGAADQVQGTAQGLGGVMQAGAEQSAGVDNRILSGSGQEARNEGAGMNSVFGHAFGILPGSTLAQIGAAYAGDAANQPRFNLQEMLANAVRDGMGDTSDYDKQILELQAGAPEMAMKLLSQRQDLVNDRLKMKWAMQDRRRELQDRAYKRKQDRKDDMWDRYMDAAKLELSKGNYQKAQAYFQLAQQREARMGQNQAFNQQYKLDHPPGATTKAKAKADALSAWGDIQHDISDDIKDLTVSIPDPNDKYGGGKIDVPMSYQKAQQILFARYGGMVKDKQRLRRIIDQILASNGIKKPRSGQSGARYGAEPGAGVSPTGLGSR